MTKKQFIDKLGEGTDFNSLNAWGFGGGIGKRYHVNGCRVSIGKAYFRHGKPLPFIRVDAPKSGNYSGSGFIDLASKNADWAKIWEIIQNIESDPVYLKQVEKYNLYLNP